MAGERRTLFEHFKEKVKGSVENRFKNPLGKRVGDSFSIDDPDYFNKMYRLEAVREVKRTINGEDFYYTDYDLRCDDEEGSQLRLRFCPLENLRIGLEFSVLLLKSFDEFPYEEGFHKNVLLGQMQNVDDNEWVDDPNFEGGFCVDDESDGKVDSTFWRVNDVKGAHEATITTIADTDKDGTAEIEEVKKSQLIYWDYWRETKDEVGDKIVDFVFVDMEADNGYFSLWRGQEIDPNRVIVFG